MARLMASAMFAPEMSQPPSTMSLGFTWSALGLGLRVGLGLRFGFELAAGLGLGLELGLELGVRG